MNPKIDTYTFSVSKLKNEQDFTKYNIEAALDEVEHRDTHVVLKFKFVLLSNPTNTKITTEGYSTIYGDQVEISKQLAPDEKNIPFILNVIYQELFPLFFIMSKSMQIPCPAYRLSQMSTPSADKMASSSLEESKSINEKVQVENLMESDGFEELPEEKFIVSQM